MNAEFSTLCSDLRRFLAGDMTASEAVNCVDEFVSNDIVYDLPTNLSELVLKLQDEAAFYVKDEIERSKYASYIGENELRTLVESFVNAACS